MQVDTTSTEHKTLRINLEGKRFGIFAEIGAGQEVVRWFFHVGRASKTVAKSISAYDMVVSDDLYGPTDHYVSRGRLEAMLDREYNQLVARLEAQRGSTSAFFVFADTVATRTASPKPEGHGWLGVRFQSHPGSAPSEIIIHVRMSDNISAREQEALGVLGVNLLYGAFYHHDEPRVLISTLMDGLGRERVEIDMIKLAGQAFEGIDNRLMSLQLLEQGLTEAAMFTAEGETVQPAEVLYKKPILVERGSFRPVTNVTLRMLEQACRQFQAETSVGDEEPVAFFEMTLSNLMSENGIDHDDFLARADLLGSLRKPVMISNFTRFDRLSSYLRRYTQNWIVMVVGYPTLREIFNEKYYEELSGGLLEGIGLLFRGPFKLYVHAAKEFPAGEAATAEALQVAPKLRHLYAYLYENGLIESIREIDENQLHVTPGDVLARISAGDSSWEEMVPPPVAALIRERRLWH